MKRARLWWDDWRPGTGVTNGHGLVHTVVAGPLYDGGLVYFETVRSDTSDGSIRRARFYPPAYEISPWKVVS